MKNVLVIFSFFFFSTGSILAQESSVTFERKSMETEPTDEKILIDGILDENVWKKAKVYGDFYITQPVDGQKSSKKSEVQLTYDENNLYVAARLFDDNNYVITTLKRDNWGDSDDFSILIDPQNQKQNGFAFGTNALGSPSEALVTPNRPDPNWDNKWFVATQNYEDHWTVEMAIPFKSLRFKSSSEIWGINFIRVDPGENEIHVWSPVPRQFESFDIGYYGSLKFKKAPEKQGKNVALIPYVSPRIDQIQDQQPNTLSNFSFGADAKVALTSGLNLDLTANPDFSQVEVDQQVTNLTRFNIFLPERRQFFLENGDMFTRFGQMGISPFFSRRVGLDESGRTVPILFGARLTGNINEKLRIGTFSMQTAATDDQLSQNYSAMSFQHVLGARSGISGIFLNRQAFDQEGWNGDFGRNAGANLDLSTKNGVWVGNAGYMHSFKDGIQDKNQHIYGGLAYNGQRFRAFILAQNIGKNYFVDMGINPRVENYNPVTNQIVRIGYTNISSNIDYYYYPQNSNTVNFHWSGMENYIYINEGGTLNEWYTRVRHFLFFKNTSELRFRLNNNFVQLIYPFALTAEPLPVGNYNMTEFNIQYKTDQRKLLNADISAIYGEFYNGNKLTYKLELNYRVQPWGRFALGLEQNYISLPEPYGKLNLTLATTRIDINFSTNVFWTTFFQYNTQTSNFNLNTRLQWRYAPMSDLFLVYTDNYLVENYFGPKSRSLVLKCSYWLGL